MNKSRRSLFAAALFVALALGASIANAEPVKAQEAASFCSSLKTVADLAVKEALLWPDLNIVNTEIYKEIARDRSRPEENEVFKLALLTAWDVIKQDGTPEQAGEVVKASCLKGLS